MEGDTLEDVALSCALRTALRITPEFVRDWTQGSMYESNVPKDSWLAIGMEDGRYYVMCGQTDEDDRENTSYERITGPTLTSALTRYFEESIATKKEAEESRKKIYRRNEERDRLFAEEERLRGNRPPLVRIMEKLELALKNNKAWGRNHESTHIVLDLDINAFKLEEMIDEWKESQGV